MGAAEMELSESSQSGHFPSAYCRLSYQLASKQTILCDVLMD